ncbi:MAG: hypothetical protein ACYCS1_11025 [Gammaproteobacteria bacterium]
MSTLYGNEKNPIAAGRSDPQRDLDLVDLWLILQHYQKAFWATFAVVLLAGVGWFLLQTPRYTYTSVITLGGIRRGPRFTPIIQPASAVLQLNSRLIPETLENLKTPRAYGSVAGIRVQATFTGRSLALLLRARGTLSQGRAMRFLMSRVGSRFDGLTNPSLTSWIGTQTQLLTPAIANLTTQIHALERSKPNFPEWSPHAPPDRDLTAMFNHNLAMQTQMMLYHERMKLFQERFHLARLRANLESPLHVRLTHAGPVIRSPHRTGSISWMKLIAFSVLIGVFMGILVVMALQLKRVARARTLEQSMPES